MNSIISVLHCLIINRQLICKLEDCAGALGVAKITNTHMNIISSLTQLSRILSGYDIKCKIGMTTKRSSKTCKVIISTHFIHSSSCNTNKTLPCTGKQRMWRFPKILAKQDFTKLFKSDFKVVYR